MKKIQVRIGQQRGMVNSPAPRLARARTRLMADLGADLPKVSLADLVGTGDNLVSNHQSAPRRALHRVEVVLVRIRAGEEKVVDGRRLRRRSVRLSDVCVVRVCEEGGGRACVGRNLSWPVFSR